MDIQALMAQRKLQAKQARPSETVERVYTNIALANETVTKLKELEAACAGIVQALPLQDRTARELRKWRPVRVYRMGLELELLSGLVTGIKYAANEHRELMLQATGLSEVLIDALNDAIGQRPYYSQTTNTIVEGKLFDVKTFKELVMLLEDELDIMFDLSSITEAKVNLYNQAALAQAETLRQQTINTERLGQTTLQLTAADM